MLATVDWFLEFWPLPLCCEFNIEISLINFPTITVPTEHRLNATNNRFPPATPPADHGDSGKLHTWVTKFQWSLKRWRQSPFSAPSHLTCTEEWGVCIKTLYTLPSTFIILLPLVSRIFHPSIPLLYHFYSDGLCAYCVPCFVLQLSFMLHFNSFLLIKCYISIFD